jgi:hypothetical protein
MKGSGCMANQYEYEDDYEEQDNGPAELRKALKKAQKEREAVEAELSKLRSDMRSRSVKDVLASKGVSDKLAKLIPSDIDTPEQIDAWLAEYSDVFGLKPADPVQPSVDEETVRDNQRINNVTSTAQNPSGEQTQHQKVMGAKTKDELDQLLFGQSLGR